MSDLGLGQEFQEALVTLAHVFDLLGSPFEERVAGYVSGFVHGAMMRPESPSSSGEPKSVDKTLLEPSFSTVPLDEERTCV
jgi:hypothetical protein